jgi:pilus assembly protein FimV
MARKHKLAAAILSLGCLNVGSVWALGLGEITLESFLNEPLKAQVNLLNTGGLHSDEIRIRLATSEDFERMGVDRAYFLTGIKFEVKVDDSGQGVIVMTSDDPVLEPYLDFIVEARWPSGRLLREYTVLVDPPVFDTSTPVISASERVAEVDGEPLPAKKKPEPEVTSGTRVDVRKSELAPGAMPQRDFGSDASPTPLAGSRYMIKRDETLWEIAQAGKPEGTSVHQAMLDIQRLNPEAFIDGNINRIKAGYIIYLPSAGDISSDDLAAALEEVRQQNDDWRAGRASEPGRTAAASLRISADPVAETSSVDGGDGPAQGAAVNAAAALEDLEKVELEKADVEGQLAAMADRVETLERIVDLKDEQIAALQAALEQAEAAPAGDATEAAPAAATPEQAAVQPAVTPQPVPQPAPKADSGSGNWLYIIGGLVIALLAGLFFWRRRNAEQDVPPPTATQARPVAARDAAFEGVKLQEQAVEVDTSPEPEPAPVQETPAAAEPELPSGRGYGEKRHDEYASDVDTGDALAEADIYIAYGRHSQAEDLLKTALAGEPENAAYRLKLIELYVEKGQREAAAGQLSELRSRGDESAIARAEAIMSGAAPAAAHAEPKAPAPAPAPIPTVGAPAGAGRPMADDAEELEESFTGLEIEEGDDLGEVSDDLDLSEDFGGQGADEDMVFAAEGNQMSTKLDLARAYMDMGDEDGARQILEEVIAEGSPEQQDEARQLLARID